MTLLAFFLIRLVPGDPIETMRRARHRRARHEKLLHESASTSRCWCNTASTSAACCTATWVSPSSRRSRCCASSSRCSRPPSTRGLRDPVALLLHSGGHRRAREAHSFFDHGVMATSLTGYSMPIFLVGPAAHPAVLGAMGLTPVSGRIAVQYYIEPTTRLPAGRFAAHRRQGAFWSTASHLILRPSCWAPTRSRWWRG